MLLTADRLETSSSEAQGGETQMPNLNGVGAYLLTGASVRGGSASVYVTRAVRSSLPRGGRAQ